MSQLSALMTIAESELKGKEVPHAPVANRRSPGPGMETRDQHRTLVDGKGNQMAAERAKEKMNKRIAAGRPNPPAPH